MARPARSDAADPERPPRRRRWRGAAILLGILALVVAALGGTYAWAQTQYYVGAAGNQVVVYRGVNAAVGPLKFNRIAKRTSLRVTDLNPSVQSQVRSGITADSRSDADRIVQRLQGEQKPLCRPVATSSPSATSATTPSVTGSPAPTSGSGSTGRTASAAHSTPRSRIASGTTGSSRGAPAALPTVHASATAAAGTTGAASSPTDSGPAPTSGTSGSSDCRRTS
jgi:protein phosphatase